MEELNVALGNFATLALVVGGGVSVIAFAFAGFTFLTAQGDPGRLAQAKGGVIGVVAGLGVMGASFIIPNVVSETVIEPAGGGAIRVEHGVDCDRILKQQLVFQKHANNADRIQQVISEIQLKNKQCTQEWWNPMVEHGGPDGGVQNDSSNPFNSERNHSRCFGARVGTHRGHRARSLGFSNTNHETIYSHIFNHQEKAIGGFIIPVGLRIQNNPGYAPQRGSGRDADNNILVYWAYEDEERPADSGTCWMYVEEVGTWFSNYN